MDHLDDRGCSIRFAEHQKLIQDIMDVGVQAGCTGMVHLGDLTEHRNPNSLESQAAAALFARWLQDDRFILGAAGNHDGTQFAVSSSSFEPLATMAMGRIRLAHEPQVFALNGVTVALLPYLHGRTPDEVGQALDAAWRAAKPDPKVPAYLFMHYGVTGVMVGAKNLVLPGDNLAEHQFHAQRFKAVFAGHIHKQQVCHAGATPVYFPGSPDCEDFGERHDNKGFAILDTVTGKVEMVQLPEAGRRRWVQVEWPIAWPALRDGEPWRETDIVKVVGEHARGIDARAELEALHQAGLPRPFALKWEVTAQRADRVARDGEVSQANGLLDAATALAKKMFADSNPEDLGNAMVEVAQALRDSRKPPFSDVILPVSLEVKDFLTYASLRLDDMATGEPVLISGPNGLGKTNAQEAILFALTGRTSKGLNMGDLVRQGQKKASVTLTLAGSESTFLVIERVITKTKAGGTQKLKVFVQGAGDKFTLDGNIADVQRSLDELLGVGYLGLKTTNFMFQKDPDPFTRAEPGDRKKILADVQCLEPVYRAFKALNESRLVKQRACLDAQAAVRAAQAYRPARDAETLEQDRQKAAQAAQEAQGGLSQASSAVGAQKATLAAQRRTLEGLLESLSKQPDHSGTLAGLNRELAALLDQHQRTRDRLVKQFDDTKAKLDALALRPDAQVDVLEAAVRAGEAKVAEAEKAKADTEAQVATARTAVGVASGEVTRLLRDLNKAKSGTTGACSLCGQQVTAEHLAKEIALAETALNTARMALEREEASLKVRQTADEAAWQVRAQVKVLLDADVRALAEARGREALKAELTASLEATRAEGKANNANKEQREARLRNEIAVVAKQVAAATKQRQELTQAVEAARATTTAQEATLAELERALAGAQARVTAAETDLKLIEKEREALTKWETETREREVQAQATQRALDIAGMACAVVDPKGGLPVYLVDIQLPFLEERANAYMEQLGMADLRVSLSTVEEDKETLAVLVDNGFEPRLDIRAYSGGQLDRVEVALKMAMADLAKATRGSTLGLMCLDEPTGGLDDAGKEALAALLFQRCAQDYPCTYVVSHDPRMASAFPRRLLVSKAKDGSTTLA